MDLTVHKGEFLAILGGNGAGKTTTLKMISGLKKPYRGSISIHGKVAHLPQNPEALFVKKTVSDDLIEVFGGTKTPKAEQKSKVAYVSELCHLNDFLDRHPYDLSGGEKQRVALAKILLLDPDILLLDEPTKGFDAEFKQEFADILEALSDRGVTIVMVSHDVEFCAKYAMRCALFFDGNIVTDGTPREFFSGNGFYTTAANRMARDILPDAVTEDDVIVACGGKVETALREISEAVNVTSVTEGPKEHAKKLPLWRKALVAISELVAVYLFLHATGTADLSKLVNSGGMTALGADQLKLYAVMIVSLFVLLLVTDVPNRLCICKLQRKNENYPSGRSRLLH